MKKLMPFLLGSMMLFTVACSNTESSTTEPNLSEAPTEEVAPEAAVETPEEATGEVAEQPVDSAEVVDDTAIETEIISSLETSLPNSELTVDAEQGAVTIAGSVASEDELSQIEPLVTQVKGVKSVDVKATVSPSGV